MSIIRTQIATNRLTLDFIKLTDSHFLYQLVNSKGWLRFIGDRKVHSLEDAISYINKIQTTENTYYWVVRKKKGNSFRRNLPP
ncbi:MAG: hypothetical protein R2822_14425 [Spirosomataceae bacterium]